jgi:peptidoglycan/xylan/chitin deacetylase (PgdA/CDA1 family)/folate-dependent phosphoribosylglycinamide formyltransferase PurN
MTTEVRAGSPQRAGKLRLVIFTAGHLLPIDSIFYERLAQDPLLDIAAIIVDEYQRRRRPLFVRIVRALREDGLSWLGFKLCSKLRSFSQSLELRLVAAIHGYPRSEESFETLTARIGVPVHRVADIQQPETLALIRSLSPDLGIIVGGRILGDSLISIPTHGTLNIHKRRVPEYRGGGPIGYWEILAGAKSIGVTIHYASSKVDAGPVLAQATIPIETCDTLASLQLKADLRGAQLYHQALRRFAQGHRRGEPQDQSTGKTYRAPSEYKVWQLQRRLEKKAEGTLPLLRDRPSSRTRLRLLLEYVTVLPRLIGVKQRLVKEQRAPIIIFFYHLVTDRPLNHMGLPLIAFVQQIDFLRRHYGIVSLNEAVERLRSGKNDQIVAAITFDDGYRDNTWAIEYLRYFGIPATFFVSIGHVRDGSAFEHDRQRGFQDALPMSEKDVRHLADDGFVIASHGIHHENFGAVDHGIADRLLRQSRELIGETCGQTPTHFSFPKGQRTNITATSFALALKHYAYIYSAYGGYCFPQVDRRHFLRTGNPTDVREMAMVMSGYTGFRQCLTGNAWGLKTAALDPFVDRRSDDFSQPWISEDRSPELVDHSSFLGAS